MRRIAVAVFALSCGIVSAVSAQHVRVTTWNLQWFPSGSPNRVSHEVEEQHILAAAEKLRTLDPDVILLQEMRDWSACDRLADALKPSEYHTIVCSAFRDTFGGVLGQQQVAILAKQWAQVAWSEGWAHKGKVDPPRGFAFAAIRYGGRDIAFYSLHLKSNLTRRGGDLEPQLNIAKRELAADQVIEHSRAIEQTILPSVKHIVIGGDFNTNRDQSLFVSERTLSTMTTAGFVDAFSGFSLSDRITHPGSGHYPDATFDYLFFKNLKTTSTAIASSRASDHRPVTCDFEVVPLSSPSQSP